MIFDTCTCKQNKSSSAKNGNKSAVVYRNVWWQGDLIACWSCLKIFSYLLLSILKEIIKGEAYWRSFPRFIITSYIILSFFFLNNFLSCVNINDLNMSLNYAEWNDLGLQNKPVLLSLCSFKYCWSKTLSETETKNSFSYFDSSTCYIKFSWNNFCVFYSVRETFIMFWKLQLNLYFTGQHKSQNVHVTSIISHLAFE